MMSLISVSSFVIYYFIKYKYSMYYSSRIFYLKILLNTVKTCVLSTMFSSSTGTMPVYLWSPFSTYISTYLTSIYISGDGILCHKLSLVLSQSGCGLQSIYTILSVFACICPLQASFLWNHLSFSWCIV